MTAASTVGRLRSNMDIQQRIGADIVMQLDQCIGYPSPKEAVAASTKLSWRVG